MVGAETVEERERSPRKRRAQKGTRREERARKAEEQARKRDEKQASIIHRGKEVVQGPE